MPHLEPQELATILAALRLYQQQGMGDPKNRPPEIHDIATANDAHVSLDADDVEALYGRLSDDETVEIVVPLPEPASVNRETIARLVDVAAAVNDYLKQLNGRVPDVLRHDSVLKLLTTALDPFLIRTLQARFLAEAGPYLRAAQPFAGSIFEVGPSGGWFWVRPDGSTLYATPFGDHPDGTLVELLAQDGTVTRLGVYSLALTGDLSADVAAYLRPISHLFA